MDHSAPVMDADLARRIVFQPARGDGYRANVDAFHLARFAAAGGRPARAAFDLGAGSGAVGLALLALEAAARVTFVEIDEAAAAFAAKNLAAHGWEGRGDVLRADVARLPVALDGTADLVVCNPPYVEAGRGRLPPEPRRARARMGSLALFVGAARKLAGRRARVCFVYPANELVTLRHPRSAGLGEATRTVHARGASARIALINAGQKAGGTTNPVIEPRGRSGDMATPALYFSSSPSPCHPRPRWG